MTSPHRRAAVHVLTRLLHPPLRLDVGCPQPRDGWTTIDLAGRPTVVGDACALPLRTDSVALVRWWDVLYYVADLTAALREGWRVLRPGGWLIIVDPWMYPAVGPASGLRRLTPAGWRTAFADAAIPVPPIIEPLNGAGAVLATALAHRWPALARWAWWPAGTRRRRPLSTSTLTTGWCVVACKEGADDREPPRRRPPSRDHVDD